MFGFTFKQNIEVFFINLKTIFNSNPHHFPTIDCWIMALKRIQIRFLYFIISYRFKVCYNPKNFTYIFMTDYSDFIVFWWRKSLQRKNIRRTQINLNHSHQ